MLELDCYSEVTQTKTIPVSVVRAEIVLQTNRFTCQSLRLKTIE